MAVYNHGLPIRVVQGTDTSADTVIPEVLEKGFTAHDKDGNPIVGTLDTDAIRAEGYTEGQTAGYNSGYSEGKADGIAAGKQAEYDTFWDEYQEKGNRSYYECAFGSLRWNDKTYKPKYHIRPIASYNRLFEGSRMTDTKVDVDFSQITSPKTIERIFSYNSSLITIRKLIINENIIFAPCFEFCDSLINLTVEGTIAQNGFDVHWSHELSRASIESVINALSPTTTGLTVTLCLDAVNKAFETSEGAMEGSTSDEWLALAATKANWTISLINS